MTQSMSDEDDRGLLVLYGSQTGTAQDVAERIGREARRRHFRARVSSMDEYDRSRLFDERYIICVAATTGQGDEPTNMKAFWKALRQSNLPSDFLGEVEFTTFGLGDSTYPKYNWVAKKLHRRLEQLGATEFYERGEGDDQNHNGFDTTLDPWLKGLWDTLLARHPLPRGAEIVPPTVRPPPRMRLRPPPPSTAPTIAEQTASPPVGTVPARLMRNDRVTADDHFQDTREIELEFDEDLHFLPGAVAELRPENPPEDVEKFAELMRWTPLLDDWFDITENLPEQQPLPRHWPKKATLRRLLTVHLDIFSVPRRSFFEFLAYFTSDLDETEKLREFGSAEGQDDMHDYATRTRRTIFETLQEFRSARIPLDYIADVFPEIRPRQFSIASSPKVYPRQIHLLVAIVNYRTRLKKPRRGVCTTWLSRLQPGVTIPVGIAPGTFTLPPSPSTPILCIGPGTGIAPFRSLAQHRPLPSNLVVFGCRNAAKDFYYRSEWEKWQREGGGRLHWCASRDQEDKVYVQDEIVEHGDEVWRCVDGKGGWIYISGSAGQMPKAVRKTLKQAFQTHGGLDEDGSERYLAQLEKQGRLQEETWS